MIHPDLLQSLATEEDALGKELARSSGPGSSSVKAYADRKLNALVPEAIDTLESGLRSGFPSDRTKAAAAILDRAPATAPAVQALPPAPTLQPEVAALLVASIAKMFGSSIYSAGSKPLLERKLNEEATVTIVDAPKSEDSGRKPKGRSLPADRKPAARKSSAAKRK